jgi:hypothetical protein
MVIRCETTAVTILAIAAALLVSCTGGAMGTESTDDHDYGGVGCTAGGAAGGGYCARGSPVAVPPPPPPPSSSSSSSWWHPADDDAGAPCKYMGWGGSRALCTEWCGHKGFSEGAFLFVLCCCRNKE